MPDRRRSSAPSVFGQLQKSTAFVGSEVHSDKSGKKRAERHERFNIRSSRHVQQGSSAQSHNPKDVFPSGETSSKVEEAEMEKREMPRRRIAGKKTVENAHGFTKKNALSALILVSRVHFQTHRKQNRNDKLLTVILTRARDRVSVSCRLFHGQVPQEKTKKNVHH